MIGHQLSFDKRNLRPKFGYLSPTGQNRQAKRGRFDRPCFTGLYKPPQNRTPLFKHNGDLVNHPLRIVEARQAAIHARLCLAPESPVLIAHPPRRSKSPCPGGDRLPRPGGGRSSRPGGGNAAVQSSLINPRHATTPLSPDHSSATGEAHASLGVDVARLSPSVGSPPCTVGPSAVAIGARRFSDRLF